METSSLTDLGTHTFSLTAWLTDNATSSIQKDFLTVTIECLTKSVSSVNLNVDESLTYTIGDE